MYENDLELFKQAINEGLSNKLDRIVNSYSGEIACSERHKLAMRTIVYGKVDEAPERKKLPMKRIIAIIVAAALLLTSCGIIFRNQIREIFRDLYVRLTYGEDASSGRLIDDIYMLTYVPEGYSLEREIIDLTFVQYKYVNEENEHIVFEQCDANSSIFVVDSEDGYSEIKEIEEYNVYYRSTKENHIYILIDGKYFIWIKSSTGLSAEEIIQIIEGITIK